MIDIAQYRDCYLNSLKAYSGNVRFFSLNILYLYKSKVSLKEDTVSLACVIRLKKVMAQHKCLSISCNARHKQTIKRTNK